MSIGALQRKCLNCSAINSIERENCYACGAGLVPGVADQDITQASGIQQSLESDPSVAGLLNLLAWIVLIFGVGGGIWLWSQFGTIPDTFGIGSRGNPIGTAIALAAILQSLIAFALLAAAARAVTDLHWIRVQTRAGRSTAIPSDAS